MDNFSLYLFTGVCAWLLLWGMLHRERVYQYPYLIGAIFSAFLIPQAWSLVENPGAVPSSSVDRALIMGVLCMFMAWAGYSLAPLSVALAEPAPLDKKNLWTGAFVVMVMTLAATGGMSAVSPEEAATGTGPFTILSFFSGFAVVSFPLFSMFFLRKPTLTNLGWAAASSLPIVLAVFFAGRRSQTAEFLVVMALVLYFEKGIVLDRALSLSAVLFAAFLIPVLALIRQEFWSYFLSGDLESIPFTESMGRVLRGDILELRNAAAAIEGTLSSDGYGFGTGYWNALIFRYVPGQIVGFELKNSLMLRVGTNPFEAIGYVTETGTTLTAIGDTFTQFGYFGCCFFFLQGVLFKNLWVLAAERKSLMAQICYIAVMPVTLVEVTHGSVWFVQGSAIVFLLVYAIKWFARAPRLEISCDVNR